VVYGSIATSALWWNTGNTEPGDGYTYRGRGFNQITFKSNYKKYGEKIGEDLLTTPDRLNDPIVAAKAVLAFFEEWNWGKKLSTLSFTNKNDATRLFARINSGNRDIYAAWEDLAINFWSIFTVENNLT
jgi:predicted chitinase